VLNVSTRASIAFVIDAPTRYACALKDSAEQKSDERILDCKTYIGTKIQRKRNYVDRPSSEHVGSISSNRWGHTRNFQVSSDSEVDARYRRVEVISKNR
jgi:hypothetical protein